MVAGGTTIQTPARCLTPKPMHFHSISLEENHLTAWQRWPRALLWGSLGFGSPEMLPTRKHCLQVPYSWIAHTNQGSLAPRWHLEFASKHTRSSVPLEDFKPTHNYLNLRATLKYLHTAPQRVDTSLGSGSWRQSLFSQGCQREQPQAPVSPGASLSSSVK